MQKELNKIADIVSGYTFRESIQNDPNGEISVLQAKNVSLSKDITSTEELVKVSSHSIRTPLFLEYNDVILVSRGSGAGTFKSNVFNTYDNNVVSSSSVYVIRIKDPMVLPKFVSLYLNSEVGQRKLQKIVSGAVIQTILLKNLTDFKIPIPPIHIQKSIIALQENVQEQERIMKLKQEIQKTIINASFNNLVNN